MKPNQLEEVNSGYHRDNLLLLKAIAHVRGGQMKALVLVGLSILLMFLFGCSGSQPAGQTAPASSQPASPSGKTPAQSPVQPISQQLSSEEICNKISDSDIKNRCLGTIKKDPSYCGKISSQNIGLAELCYEFVSVETQNPALCSKLSVQRNCLALAGNDISVCNSTLEKFDDALFKGLCTSLFAAFKKDETVCDSVSDKSSCKVFVAEAKNDASLCEDAGSDTIKGRCYLSVATSTKDRSICDKVNSRYYKQTCLAVVNQDYDLCKDTINSQDCTLKVAIAKQDYDKCSQNNIQLMGTTPDDCYFKMAMTGLLKSYPQEIG